MSELLGYQPDDLGNSDPDNGTPISHVVETDTSVLVDFDTVASSFWDIKVTDALEHGEGCGCSGCQSWAKGEMTQAGVTDPKYQNAVFENAGKARG